MVFGEAALAGEGGHDRNLEKFGELPEFLPGLGIENPRPRMEQGFLRPDDGLYGCLHALRIGHGPCHRIDL